MKTLILSHDQVVRLLPMKECIAVMREAVTALAKDQIHQPLRTIIRPPDAKGVMGLMPAYGAGAVVSGNDASGHEAAFGLKVVCVFPQNPAKGKDAHQGAVSLFSGETGELLAMMNASAITAIRTAAVSGVATDLLAKPTAGTLAMIGSGVQARTHLMAMSEVRSIKRCRIASRRFEQARKLAEEMSPEFMFPLEPVETVEEALQGADLIVTATNAAEPVVKREWISPGAHLNVVGSSRPNTREVDSETMAAASLFVDRRESTINEAGDYLFALREGLIGSEHIRAELGEVLIGEQPGRTSAEEITLFKSLGLGVEDLFAAGYVFRRAKKGNVGTWVEF
ncbi:MAG TPA: ornithine cyclodeaminase family protein [Pyrinomonadaceae bacterium]|nr:ornithine cyclodeaminase family protein [Pyrinomonadaceae bacterium]